MIATWDYESYWCVVVGDEHDAGGAVAAYRLTRDSLETWLARAEAASWLNGDGAEGAPLPASWAALRARAYDEIATALAAS